MDFFEIDFLKTQSKKSADAIPLRYEKNEKIQIHITDGGYQDDGDNIIGHINQYYDSPSRIDAVIVTHPDADHAGGLKRILEYYDVVELWMLRPWMYADEIIDRFSRFTNVDNLKKRLKEIYPSITALEKIAEEKGIPIREPFQSAKIGEFTVLAPTKKRYLDLIVESDKTPESIKTLEETLSTVLGKTVRKLLSFIRSRWGEETFPATGTSPENEMSIIQYGKLCDKKILLTGDAGRESLKEAAEYAPNIGLILPGIDKIQVPHHGSRHNVSTEILDIWLGDRLKNDLDNSRDFEAIVCASAQDDDHPRKSVRRGFIHRGGEVFTTENACIRISINAPQRVGWYPATRLEYPQEQEE